MDPVHLIYMAPALATSLKKKREEVRLYESPCPGEYFVSDFSLQFIKAKKVPHKVIRSLAHQDLPIQVSYPSHSYLFEPPHQEALNEVMAYAMARQKGNKRMQILYLGRGGDTKEKGFSLDRPGGKRSYQWWIPTTPQKVTDIRTMFPKISATLKDPDTKVILSLGSGGIRLFAHPALMKFIDLLDLRPHVDEIWGSSGGAIAGLPYAMGVDPTVIEQEGYHLYNERYSFRFSPSKLEVLKNLISDAFLHSSENMLQGFIDCQSHLEELLKKHILEKKPTIPFYCLAFNLTLRRREVLTPEKVDGKRYLMPVLTTDALDSVVASSSIPILYVPKKIKRGKNIHHYIDGGTTEEVPLISPYRKWLRDRLHQAEKRKKLLILSVNLFPQVGTSRLFNHWIFKKVPAFRFLQLSATYADLVRQARIDEHKGYLNRDAAVTQWELTFPMGGTGVVDTKVIPKVIETAQRSFFQQLLKIEKSIQKPRKDSPAFKKFKKEKPGVEFE